MAAIITDLYVESGFNNQIQSPSQMSVTVPVVIDLGSPDTGGSATVSLTFVIDNHRHQFRFSDGSDSYSYGSFSMAPGTKRVSVPLHFLEREIASRNKSHFDISVTGAVVGGNSRTKTFRIYF